MEILLSWQHLPTAHSIFLVLVLETKASNVSFSTTSHSVTNVRCTCTRVLFK